MLGAAVVDSGRANRTDHLLYALGLTFRARAARAPANRADIDDAVEHLLRAADSANPPPAEVVRTMHNLVAALDRLRPEAGVTGRLATVTKR